jgi:alkaline phosphatase
MVSDMLAFDDAVKETVNFAKKRRDTVVVAFPDHNTGGLTLGNYNSNFGSQYSALTIEDMVEPLDGMKISVTGIVRKIGSDQSAQFGPTVARSQRDCWITQD